jgi:3,5-epimerase/4-reductase
MSVLPELLPIMIDMCEKGTTGTINLTNPGLISHNEILEMYREIVDADFTWENFDAEEQRKILESERSNNFLDTSKLESMYKVKHIKDAIREAILDGDITNDYDAAYAYMLKEGAKLGLFPVIK